MKTRSQHVGYQLQGLMMDNEGILPEALNDAAAGGARVLYTMPTLQNPTGCIMSANRRREIASLARQHDLWIVEDDVYAVFAAGTAPPPLARRSEEHTSELQSLMRISYAVF